MPYSIWFTQVSSTYLDKLEVMQIKVLRNATGCNQKAVVSNPTTETGVLTFKAYLELWSQSSMQAPSIPPNFFVPQIVH